MVGKRKLGLSHIYSFIEEEVKKNTKQDIWFINILILFNLRWLYWDNFGKEFCENHFLSI